MRVDTKIVVGKTVVGTENRWLLGPIEGFWWVKRSWLVIPLGIFLLVWPGWLHMGIRKMTGTGGGPAVITSVPAPVVNVTVTPAPMILPSVPKSTLTPSRPVASNPRPQQQIIPIPTPVPALAPPILPERNYFY